MFNAGHCTQSLPHARAFGLDGCVQHTRTTRSCAVGIHKMCWHMQGCTRGTFNSMCGHNHHTHTCTCTHINALEHAHTQTHTLAYAHAQHSHTNKRAHIQHTHTGKPQVRYLHNDLVVPDFSPYRRDASHSDVSRRTFTYMMVCEVGRSWVHVCVV